jgi:hypothetical protein
MHGGNSRGPRTPEGKAAVLRAVTKHGRYSKKAIQERREARAGLRELEALLKMLDV